MKAMGFVMKTLVMKDGWSGIGNGGWVFFIQFRKFHLFTDFRVDDIKVDRIHTIRYIPVVGLVGH